MLPADGDIADADGKVHGAAFVAECRLELVAGTAGGEHIHQVIVHTWQLADVGKYFQPEQMQGFVVLLIDGSVVVQYDDAGIYAVEDKLVVFLLLGGFAFYII